MTKVIFTSDGYKLAGNFFMPDSAPKKMAFLFIQSWTGHQNIDAAQALASLGYPTLTYDMRGNGDSEGDLAKFSRADFIKDAAVAYDYLKQQIDPDSAIGVVGSSFGSYTAVLLSEKRAVSYLSLRVPASYPDEGFDEPHLAQFTKGFGEWRKKELAYNQNHAFNALHAFTGSVQIVEAGADEQVLSQAPKNYANAVADKSKLTYEYMVNAPHSLVNDALRADYKKRLVTWVGSL